MSADATGGLGDPAAPGAPEASEHGSGHLGAAAAGISHALARPRIVALSCIAMLAAAGWLYLGLMAAGMPGGHAHHGGHDAHVGYAAHGSHATPAMSALVEAASGPASAVASATGFALVLATWPAMSLAMMLPTAAPMVITYADIGEVTPARVRPQLEFRRTIGRDLCALDWGNR